MQMHVKNENFPIKAFGAFSTKFPFLLYEAIKKIYHLNSIQNGPISIIFDIKFVVGGTFICIR